MSIGNLRDQGNQSKNYPWQHNVLKGLQCICDAIEELQSGIDVTIVNPLGQARMDDSVSVTIAADQLGASRTPGIIRPTGSGNVNSVASRFFSVSVANVGTANGTVLGATIKPGEVLNFSGDAVNNFFESFAYNATGTEFVIIYVA